MKERNGFSFARWWGIVLKEFLQLGAIASRSG